MVAPAGAPNDATPPARGPLPRRAAILHHLAAKTSAKGARERAFAIAGTADDGPAARLPKGTVGTKLHDGRTVPGRFDMQIENVLSNLEALGMMPDYEGHNFGALLHVARAVASYDRNGESKDDDFPDFGSVATIRQIARRAGCDVKTASKSLRYFRHLEWVETFERWAKGDREEMAPGTGIPATGARSTVRLFHLLPLKLTPSFTVEQLASLAASSLPRPTLDPLPPPADAATEGAAAPASDAAAPRPTPAPAPPLRLPAPPPLRLPQKAWTGPKRLTLAAAVAALELPPLPDDANLEPLRQPLEKLNAYASTDIKAEVVGRIAAKVKLHAWFEVGRAMAELARDAELEAKAARAVGNNPVPWNVRRMIRALVVYLEKKLWWITEGPGALRARHLAAVQGAEALLRVADNSPAALRELTGRDAAPSLDPADVRHGLDVAVPTLDEPVVPSPIPVEEQMMRLRWIRVMGTPEQAEIEAEMRQLGMMGRAPPPE